MHELDDRGKCPICDHCERCERKDEEIRRLRRAMANAESLLKDGMRR